jgi:RNA polymerase sigma factor (sigma-70 family)
MDDSRKLLADYVKNGSESAFRELVTRYINLVHSTAVRLVNGDAHLAEDITQTVFADLARKAHSLPADVMLGGWLHRDAYLVAGTTMRGERRRHYRERQAVAMNLPDDHTAANLALVAPILDEAINQLEPADRTAILLRFFEQREFRAVGEAMGSNEDAARMRVSRALDKLQTLLKNRGVTFSAAALGAALAAGAVSAAPLGLAATVAGTALAGGVAGGATAPFLKFMTMSNFKIAVISAAAVAALAAPVVVQHQSFAKLRDENQTLRQQAALLAPLQTENEKLSNLVVQAKTGPAPANQQVRELARLRGEVAVLRQQTNDLVQAQEAMRQIGRGQVVAGRRGGRGFTDNGKRVLRNMTMAEFAKFIGDGLQAPVADQTGLTGSYDIELTRPWMGAVDETLGRVTGILLNELGLQLIPFAGPFKAEEEQDRRQKVAVVWQLPDGTWTNAVSTNDAPTWSNTTNGGFAIRLDHPGALGLKTANGEPFPDEQSVGQIGGRRRGGAGLDTQGFPPLVANKLSLIEASKMQWALEYNKQNSDTPTWEDLGKYLGRGPNGDLSYFTNAPEGDYIIGPVGQSPGFRINPTAQPAVFALGTPHPDLPTTDQDKCINHLRYIDSAKQQWALEKRKQNKDTPTMEDLKPYLGPFVNEVTVCPDGGVYTIGTVGEKPTCSIPGHVLP